MKYLFVSPHKLIAKGNIPYGMGIVATYAKHNGINVEVFQSNVNESKCSYLKRLEQRLAADHDVGCVCIGSMATAYMETIELISIAKKFGAITILGGNLVDPYPELIAEHSGADYCIVGEGEITFLELCRCINNNATGIKEVAGLCYQSKSGEIIQTAQRAPIENLDELPFLDYDLLGQRNVMHYNRVLYIYASRSCPFHCTFCYHLKGFPYRQRSLENIFAEIEQALSMFGDDIDYIDFFDDLFNINEQRVLDFCERITKTGKRFGIQVRLDLLTEKSIVAIARAGCCKISVGIESADNKVLKSMRKNENQSEIANKIEIILQNNLFLIGNLLIGDPLDGRASLHKNIEFYKKYSNRMYMDFIMTETYPGTELYNVARSRGLIKDEIEYLKTGNYLVNLTSLEENEYEILKMLCNSVNWGRSFQMRALLPQKAVFSVDLSGKFQIEAYCPHCLTYQTSVGLDGIFAGFLFLTTHTICPHCGQVVNYELPIFSAIKNYDYYEAIFAPYKGKRILIDGIYAPEMKAAVMQSQSLRNCLVGLIDDKYALLTNQQYCGLSVSSPCVINQFNYDILCTYDNQVSCFVFTP